MTLVIASDKFKGSLDAAGVAAAVGEGVRRVRADVHTVAVPVADGGDGTLAAAVAAGFERVPVTVGGPTGEPVVTAYARSAECAVVELADACGLALLPGGKPVPMTASSRGVGEVIAAAVAAGCRDIVLGIGGSASTDGGAGMLRALGARLLDERGDSLPEGGGALASAVALDLEPARHLMADVALTVACDVDNPLTGPTGAAQVYGPQKGADPTQVAELDRALGHWADLVRSITGSDVRDRAGAGAAGGVGFAALAVLDARLRSGIELVLDLVGFADQLAGATLVVTGEGALDEQTLHGKAPAGVAAAAASAGIPVVAVCGVNRLSADRLASAGIESAYALVDVEPDVARCLADPAPLLVELGARIAADHL